MDFICQSCGLKGDGADFPDMICPECDGQVVTVEEMDQIEKQHDEFMNRGKEIQKEWKTLDDVEF